VSIAAAAALLILPGKVVIGAPLSPPASASLPSRCLAAYPPPGGLCAEELAQGKFLIAKRHLRDPNFSKTVVLLVDYSQRGAKGLIINRPTDVRISEALPEMEALHRRPDTLYVGGPVALGLLLLLIRSGSEIEESRHVFEDVYLSSSPALLQRLIEEEYNVERFRVYAGYAGWAPGQLDHEVSRGDWYISSGDAQTVFERPSSEIWSDLIRRCSAQLVKAREPVRRVTPPVSISR
jgi:putative transcriptional regulator